MGILNRKEKAESELELVQAQSAPVVSPDIQADEEIDLQALIYVLVDKVHYIILCLLLGAVLFNAYAFFCIEPTYQSTAKMYVVSASNDSVVDLTDLDIGTSLTSDYEQLILSYPVLDQVIAALQLNMGTGGLRGMIALENPENTRILNITVTSTDPQQAMNIANKLMEISIEYLPETMSTNPPNVAQWARLADGKSAPDYSRYTLMGAMGGAALCCLYYLMRYLMNDTVRTPDEMERYFGVAPLTVIPDSDVFDVLDRKEKRSSGKPA